MRTDEKRKTTVKITKRKTGYTALIAYPWGEKVRLLGCTTKDAALQWANETIDKRRLYSEEV